MGRPARRRPQTYAFGLAAVAATVLVAGIVIVSRSTGAATLPLPPGIALPNAAGASGGPGASLGPLVTGASASPSTTGGTAHGPTGGPSGGSGTAGGSGALPPTADTPSGVPPTTRASGPALLRARYQGTGPSGVLGLGGYTGQVTISNPGTAPVEGWTVIISLPDGATVSSAAGAHYTQDATAVTFTPTNGNRTVTNGADKVFTFEVGGLLADQPTGCAIDGRPCD